MIDYLKQLVSRTVPTNWRPQVWYIPLLGVAMLLMMLRPLMLASFLEAPDFATYSAGLLVSSSFCMLGCVGLQPMLQRQMPMDLMSGKELTSLILLSQAVFVALVCAVLISGFAWVWSPIAGLDAKAFALSVLHGLSQQLFLLATIESRSRGEPLRFSYQSLIRAMVVVAGSGLAAWYARSPLASLLTEALLSLIISWQILGRVISGKSAYLLAVLALKKAKSIPWHSALALMAVMLLGFMLTNSDRWLAATLLEPEYFAYYAFAWILLAASQSVQLIMNSSVYPSLAKRFATRGRESAFSLSAKVSIFFMASCLVMALPAASILNLIISEWFNAYSLSSTVLSLFLIIATFRVSDFWTSYLIVIGKERLVLIINFLVGSIVSVVWGFVVFYILKSSATMISLAWFAFFLTISNYFCVLLVSISIRK